MEIKDKIQSGDATVIKIDEKTIQVTEQKVQVMNREELLLRKSRLLKAIENIDAILTEADKK